MVPIFIKQRLSTMLSAIHGKLSKAEAELKKCVSYKKIRVFWFNESDHKYINSNKGETWRTKNIKSEYFVLIVSQIFYLQTNICFKLFY